ncbi:MAG TPA: ABC transporter substrate-binding protein [Gaiellaceae bacterium]|nr:ABC transporter substrate-binding protein [Gaiellaceae bacterium]
MFRGIAIAACALAAAGCGERGEPLGPQEELFPLTITTGERSLTIPAPPQRIVVLDGGPEAILEAIGAGDRVVASDAGASDLPALRPDLVVAPSTADERELSAADAAGAPVYVTPDTSITEVERAITQLGTIVGEPAAARRRVSDIEQRRQRVARALRGQPRTTVFVDLGRRTTASDRTLIGDLVREARGRNVAGDAPSGLEVGVSQLLAFDPAVYVSAGGPTLEQLRRGVRTRTLRAVRSKRVYVVDRRLLTAGPAIGAGLEALARALHPDAVR